MNGNCQYDGGDYALVNSKVTASVNNNIISFGFTDSNGDYLIPIGSGLYEISITPPITTTSSCGTQSTANVFGGGMYDFKFSCGSGFDLASNISALVFPQNNYMWTPFEVKNNSCQNVSANFSITLDPKLILGQDSANINGNNVSLSVSNNVVSASNVNMPPFSVVNGYLYLKANNTTNLGDTLCVTIEATPINGDLNPINNTKTVCAKVVTSYDPNMKIVKINGKPAEGYVPNNQVMEYTIFFQNTGNYPAKDIRITDIIDAHLDFHTLKFVSSSHPCNVLLSGNTSTFYFENIWLPDSASNEPESHGYASFTINQIPGLVPGKEIHNKVDIYFDYNVPITTNTVISIIEYPASVYYNDATRLISIFPNPASDFITLANAGLENLQISFFDVSGKQIKSITGSRNMQLPVYDLPAGYYLLNIQSEEFSLPFKIFINR